MILNLPDNIELRSALSNLAVNQYIQRHNIDPMDFNFRMYVDYYIDKSDIILSEKPLPRIEEDFFLGVTVKSEHSLVIYLNQLVKGNRSNFSLCHEITHCHYDINNKIRNQTLYNIHNQPSFYTEEELLVEELANIGAGVIMVPDITILGYLETNISFPKMADVLNMSRAALFLRLKQFLMTTLSIPENRAVSLVRRFQDEGNKHFINSALIGTYSNKNQKKEIIYSFENSL